MSNSDNKILSAEQLEESFQPEYPAYTIAQWRETVASGHTIEGYWAWVHTMLTEEADLEGDMGETGDRTGGTCTPIDQPAPVAATAADGRIRARLVKVISEQLGINESDIKDDNSFVDDLGADSLDEIELVMAVEEEFEIEISDEEAEGLKTVSQALQYVNSRQKSA
jgi:acyl carrier protein